ncbi:MAG: mechanosensitive ion channel [Chitinivibrionales bacterium]|nr:mechanosensitive ion channel [Chitinivibrionales bacterium]
MMICEVLFHFLLRASPSQFHKGKGMRFMAVHISRAVYVWCVVFLGVLAAAGDAAAQQGGSIVGRTRADALGRAVAGRWVAVVGSERVSLQLRGDRTYVLGGEAGRYSFDSGSLMMVNGTDTVTYGVDVGPETLTLSGGDLKQALAFSRQSDVGAVWVKVGRLFSLERASLLAKLQRILVIVLVVVGAQALIWLLVRFSHLLIYGTWGPLRLLYRTHKKRAETLHALALNVVKYVIYFAALGVILTELGVNYAAYLASLSMVGLAIGFGSQGLVQDIVTGFFIIFENQFDVGDLVEVSGQTGVVREIGLRMTKIRSFSGQTAILPNRSIGTVVTYRHGGLYSVTELTVPSEKARAAALLAGSVAEHVRKRFADVFRRDPDVRTHAFGDDEAIVRVVSVVWPGQQWAVEQHLVPGVTQVLQAKGLLPDGAKATHYLHAQERA